MKGVLDYFFKIGHRSFFQIQFFLKFDPFGKYDVQDFLWTDVTTGHGLTIILQGRNSEHTGREWWNSTVWVRYRPIFTRFCIQSARKSECFFLYGCFRSLGNGMKRQIRTVLHEKGDENIKIFDLNLRLVWKSDGKHVQQKLKNKKNHVFYRNSF